MCDIACIFIMQEKWDKEWESHKTKEPTTALEEAKVSFLRA